MLKRFTVWIFLFAGLVTLAYAADENQNACKGDPGKWQQLFNGKDLKDGSTLVPAETPLRMG